MTSVSVQWGAWAGGGMASAETAARVERMGMAMVSPQAGLAALQGIMASADAGAVVGANPFAWPRFLQRLQPRQRTQLFQAFQPAADAAVARTAAAAHGPSSAGLGPSLSREAVAEQVAAAVAAVLGGPVASDSSLMEAGLDSLGAVELRNSLSKQFGLDLPATLTFDYPTTAAIAAFISESVVPAPEQAVDAMVLPGAALGTIPVGSSSAAATALAITGVSLRFTGGIESLPALHTALVETTELQTVGPASRWDTGMLRSADIGAVRCAACSDARQHAPLPRLQICTTIQPVA